MNEAFSDKCKLFVEEARRILHYSEIEVFVLVLMLHNWIRRDASEHECRLPARMGASEFAKARQFKLGSVFYGKWGNDN
jgi:hypothetical protein